VVLIIFCHRFEFVLGERLQRRNTNFVGEFVDLEVELHSLTFGVVVASVEVSEHRINSIWVMVVHYKNVCVSFLHNVSKDTGLCDSITDLESIYLHSVCEVIGLWTKSELVSLEFASIAFYDEIGIATRLKTAVSLC